jgi:hypothetical protein
MGISYTYYKINFTEKEYLDQNLLLKKISEYNTGIVANNNQKIKIEADSFYEKVNEVKNFISENLSYNINEKNELVLTFKEEPKIDIYLSLETEEEI